MTQVILFYADWCGFCQDFKGEDGAWNKIKAALGDDVCKEVDVDKESARKHKYWPPTSGVPQIAVVDTSGQVQYHVGATKDPQDILKMLKSPPRVRGSSKRRRSGRRAQSCGQKSPSQKDLMWQDLIWHVMEHCQHEECRTDLLTALQCAKTCCM